MTSCQALKNKEASNVKKVKSHQPMKWWTLWGTATSDHVPHGLVAVEDSLWLASRPRGPEYGDTLVCIFHVNSCRAVFFNGEWQKIDFKLKQNGRLKNMESQSRWYQGNFCQRSLPKLPQPGLPGHRIHRPYQLTRGKHFPLCWVLSSPPPQFLDHIPQFLPEFPSTVNKWIDHVMNDIPPISCITWYWMVSAFKAESPQLTTPPSLQTAIIRGW